MLQKIDAHPLGDKMPEYNDKIVDIFTSEFKKEKKA